MTAKRTTPFNCGVWCSRTDIFEHRITYRIDAPDAETAAREAINQHAERLGEPRFEDDRPLTLLGNCWHAGPWSVRVE